MGKRRNKINGSGTGTLLSVIWIAYDRYTTISSLPKDTTEFLKMLADPPWYLPWAVMLVSVFILAWAFWEKDELRDTDSVVQSPSTHGTNSPSIAAYNSTVHNHFASPSPQPTATQERKKPGEGYNFDALLVGMPAVASRIQRDKYLRNDSELLPDLPLFGLLVRVYKSVGGVPKSIKEKERFYDRIDKLIMDAVSQGNLSVWVRSGKRPLMPLSIRDWNNGSFDHRRRVFIGGHGYGGDLPEYTDITFNKDEIDAIWPPK